jgi:catechol 2,3-dioxygenase-like lactoylglutathione lyase family enzyme
MLSNPSGADQMQIGHLELFARDPATTADFYLNVLGFQPVVQQPGNLHWIALKEQEVLVRPARPAATHAPTSYDESSTALVIYTDRLDQEVERLRSVGVQVVGLGGSPRSFGFQDPDGRWIQMVDPAEQG